MFEETQEKMRRVLTILQTDLSSIRTSQATPALVENIPVEAYEGAGKLRVKELATVTVEGYSTILVRPWDQGVATKIVQAVERANIGLTPVISGGFIRMVIPPLSLERRQEYIKLMRRKLEATRVMIRQIRAEERASIHEQKEKGELSEDESFSREEMLQKLTDEFIEKIDSLGKNKEIELGTV